VKLYTSVTSGVLDNVHVRKGCREKSCGDWVSPI